MRHAWERPCLIELSSGFHSCDRLSEIYRHVCWGKGRDVPMLSVKRLDQSVQIASCLPVNIKFMTHRAHRCRNVPNRDLDF